MWIGGENGVRETVKAGVLLASAGIAPSGRRICIGAVCGADCWHGGKRAQSEKLEDGTAVWHGGLFWFNVQPR